jgi:hypothetical protein
VFCSVVELQAAIKRFLAETNADPRPFRQKKDSQAMPRECWVPVPTAAPDFPPLCMSAKAVAPGFGMTSRVRTETRPVRRQRLKIPARRVLSLNRNTKNILHKEIRKKICLDTPHNPR